MRTLKVVLENFPHLRIVARARNRQHAWALLGAGVETVIRENFAGSLEAAQITLEQLGFSHDDATAVVTRFAAYDEAMIRKTVGMKDDEKALIESSKKYAAELERIFNDDERTRGEL
jgi:voltage-gated potassium channel Kch